MKRDERVRQRSFSYFHRKWDDTMILYYIDITQWCNDITWYVITLHLWETETRFVKWKISDDRPEIVRQ